jgi:hypothetical protein
MKLGLNAKLYRNTGTFAMPTWVEVTNVQDLELSDDMTEFDASIRGGGGFSEAEPTLRNLELTFNMRNEIADTHMIALRTAYATRAAVDMQVLDGPVATVGTHGVRARFKVFEFGKPQNLADGQFLNLRLRPAPNPDGVPTEVTISGGG